MTMVHCSVQVEGQWPRG